MAARSSLRRLVAVLVGETAFVVAGAVLAYDGRGVVAPEAVALLVATAVVLVGTGIVVRWIGLVGSGAVALATAYCVGRIGEPLSIGAPAAFGVVLLGILWFGSAAIECRDPVAADPSRRQRRVGEGLTAMAIGAMAAAVVAVAARAGRGVGVLLFLGGAAAALVLLAVVWLAASSAQRAQPPGGPRPEGA